MLISILLFLLLSLPPGTTNWIMMRDPCPGIPSRDRSREDIDQGSCGNSSNRPSVRWALETKSTSLWGILPFQSSEDRQKVTQNLRIEDDRTPSCKSRYIYLWIRLAIISGTHRLILDPSFWITAPNGLLPVPALSKPKGITVLGPPRRSQSPRNCFPSPWPRIFPGLLSAFWHL